MSKISRDNKKKKAAAAKKPAAESETNETTVKKTKKRAVKELVPEKTTSATCHTCKFYDKPCKKTGEFVARKKEACAEYKNKS